MRTIGRKNRWLARALAVLGFAVCFFLPLGALGAIDAGYESSVAVPLLRSTNHQPSPASAGHQSDRTQLRSSASRVAFPRRLDLSAPSGATQAALLAALVLLGLLALPASSAGHRSSVALPLGRGPPPSC